MHEDEFSPVTCEQQFLAARSSQAEAQPALWACSRCARASRRGGRGRPRPLLAREACETALAVSRDPPLLRAHRNIRCSGCLGQGNPCWICARRASNRRNGASRSACANVVRLSVGGWSTGHSVRVRPPRENVGRPLYQKAGTTCFSVTVPLTYGERMEAVRIGYARCSTDRQDLTAQHNALVELGVEPGRSTPTTG